MPETATEAATDDPPECQTTGATGEPHRYAPLSWDAAVAVRNGIIPGPYPEDFNGPGFDPQEPTAHRPGSEDKIRVLAERYARRERLFHPRDRR